MNDVFVPVTTHAMTDALLTSWHSQFCLLFINFFYPFPLFPLFDFYYYSDFFSLLFFHFHFHFVIDVIAKFLHFSFEILFASGKRLFLISFLITVRRLIQIYTWQLSYFHLSCSSFQFLTVLFLFSIWSLYLHACRYIYL